MRAGEREKVLLRLLESVAGRPLSTLEKMDARAFVEGGKGRDSVKLCECEQVPLTECRSRGACS